MVHDSRVADNAGSKKADIMGGKEREILKCNHTIK